MDSITSVSTPSHFDPWSLDSVGAADPLWVVRNAAQNLATDAYPDDIRAVVDLVMISNQTRALSSAFSSIYASTGLINAPLVNALVSASSNINAAAYSFLHAINIFVPVDANKDGRLNIGEILDINA